MYNDSEAKEKFLPLPMSLVEIGADSMWWRCDRGGRNAFRPFSLRRPLLWPRGPDLPASPAVFLEMQVLRLADPVVLFQSALAFF